MHDITNKANKLIMVMITTLFIALTFSNSAYSQAPDTSNAVVSELTGYATVTAINGDVRRLKVGDTIKQGDRINTGNNSSLELLLSNGESYVIGPLQVFTYNIESVASLSPSTTPSSLSKNGKNLSRGSSSLSTAISAGGSPVE